MYLKQMMQSMSLSSHAVHTPSWSEQEKLFFYSTAGGARYIYLEQLRETRQSKHKRKRRPEDAVSQLGRANRRGSKVKARSKPDRVE